MYFTSCIGDAIRIPLRLTLFVVSLVLLQPQCRTTHRSCSNDETLHHSGAVPQAPSSDAQDLLPLLRQQSQPEHPHRPTQSRWDRHGFAKEVVHLLHLFVTLHVIYIVHWAHGFVPLVSPWKKKRRNFNFHLSSFSNSYSWSIRLRDSSIIAL